MSTNLVLAGAGGKMGMRLMRNLKKSDYSVKYLEVSSAGIERLAQEGITVSDAESAIPQADILVLAVPDKALQTVSTGMIPLMRKGALVFTLDPAATLAREVYQRDDLSYVIAHPSHPSVFNWEATPEIRADYFGGISAKQTVVCSLVRGDESAYAMGEQLAKTIYAPVSKVFRITPEQMGYLEPVLVETLASTCISVIREGLDEIIARGVPADAAREFLLGHLNIQLAVLFQELPGAVFSDAANKAITRAKPILFKEDWKQIFDEQDVMEQIHSIIH